MSDHTDLIQCARRAEGSEVLPGVQLGRHRADELLLKLADALEAQAARIAALNERANITPMQFHEAIVAGQKLATQRAFSDVVAWHMSEYHRIVDKYGETDPALTHLESAASFRALPLPPAPQEGE